MHNLRRTIKKRNVWMMKRDERKIKWKYFWYWYQFLKLPINCWYSIIVRLLLLPDHLIPSHPYLALSAVAGIPILQSAEGEVQLVIKIVLKNMGPENIFLINWTRLQPDYPSLPSPKLLLSKEYVIAFYSSPADLIVPLPIFGLL